MDVDVDVTDAPAASRFEARLGKRLAGFLAYKPLSGRIVLLHTEVFPDHQGRGVAGHLAAAAMAHARAGGLRVLVRCPFVESWLRRHPEEADIVDERPVPG
jgi:hypothetical protein